MEPYEHTVCICCGKDLEEHEIFAYDDVCEQCMAEWSKENQLLKDEYYRSLL